MKDGHCVLMNVPVYEKFMVKSLINYMKNMKEKEGEEYQILLNRFDNLLLMHKVKWAILLWCTKIQPIEKAIKII